MVTRKEKITIEADTHEEMRDAVRKAMYDKERSGYVIESYEVHQTLLDKWCCIFYTRKR